MTFHTYSQINNTPIGHEKPSSIKKLMKPHKNILRLIVERPQLHDRSYTGQHLPSPSGTDPSEILQSGGGAKTPPDSPPPYERKRSTSTSYGHYERSSRRQSQRSQVRYSRIIMIVNNHIMYTGILELQY